jgi:hypothetical protein
VAPLHHAILPERSGIRAQNRTEYSPLASWCLPEAPAAGASIATIRHIIRFNDAFTDTLSRRAILPWGISIGPTSHIPGGFRSSGDPEPGCRLGLGPEWPSVPNLHSIRGSAEWRPIDETLAGIPGLVIA